MYSTARFRPAARSLALVLLLLLGVARGTSAALPLIESRDGLPTLAPVLARVMPAVVNIAVIQRRPEEENPLLRDPFFRRFFGLPESSPRGLAAGSGVIVDARHGYVLTNHHVIQDASEILVTLKDNRRLPAKLVGSDAGTDIALLKIDAKNLTEVKFGDSDALRVGDFVIAIGNPFGIGQTATSGIVSALGRSGLSREGYEDFIQTDAPINPGNSGGALVNLRGELIGINSAIIGPSGGNVGIGFAVPSNMAHAVMQQLERFGEVRRGRLGISMQDLTPDLARSLAVDVSEGAVIARVEAKSPASAAGLRQGDVVVEIDGHPVRGAAELRARLGVIPAGDTVELKVRRGRETRSVSARIAKIETQEAVSGRSLARIAGASLADADREGQAVVLVAAVAPNSRAHRYGLRRGDVIIGVNNVRVGTVAALAKALPASGGFTLHLLRGDFVVTITIR